RRPAPRRTLHASVSHALARGWEAAGRRAYARRLRAEPLATGLGIRRTEHAATLPLAHDAAAMVGRPHGHTASPRLDGAVRPECQRLRRALRLRTSRPGAAGRTVPGGAARARSPASDRGRARDGVALWHRVA